ncbi:MAG: ImmA/IrrE family metallo-endopeptidase [Acidobacteriota bacterium]
MRGWKLKTIKKFLPEFNQRPVTEDDLWRVFKQCGIIVRNVPLLVDGYCGFHHGRHYILLNDRLPPRRWLFTACHELSHYLFDVPKTEGEFLFRNSGADTAREKFADAFACICLLPFPELVRLAEDPPEEDPDLLELCRSRLIVRNVYGI